MKAIVARVGASVPLLLDEIDISTDPSTRRALRTRDSGADGRGEKGGEVPGDGGGTAANLDGKGGRARKGGCGGRIKRLLALPYLPYLPYLPCLPYFAVMMKCPRRFCCQQDSPSSVQTGCSLPLLTIGEPVGRHAKVHQIVLDRRCPSRAEREVVLRAAARVAVAFDA